MKSGADLLVLAMNFVRYGQLLATFGATSSQYATTIKSACADGNHACCFFFCCGVGMFFSFLLCCFFVLIYISVERERSALHH